MNDVKMDELSKKMGLEPHYNFLVGDEPVCFFNFSAMVFLRGDIRKQTINAFEDLKHLIDTVIERAKNE